MAMAMAMKLRSSLPRAGADEGSSYGDCKAEL